MESKKLTKAELKIQETAKLQQELAAEEARASQNTGVDAAIECLAGQLKECAAPPVERATYEDHLWVRELMKYSRIPRGDVKHNLTKDQVDALLLYIEATNPTGEEE